MKNLKYLLFIIPFLFFSNVNAQTIDVSQYSYNNLGTYGGMYYGYADDSQTASNYSFGTTYQFKLNQAYFDVRYTLPASTTVTFTLNASDNDLRDTIAIYNVYDVTNQQYLNVSNFRFVSMRKVQLDFTTYNSTNEVRILLSSSSYYNYITGVANWNFTSITYDIPDNTPSSDTQDIIDSNNQNTTDIINNQNSNTQQIIDNQNDNTQAQIDSQKVCKHSEIIISYDNKDNYSTIGYLNTSDGSIISTSGFRTSDYIEIKKDDVITITRNGLQGNGTGYCLYNSNKTLINCVSYGTSLSFDINVSQNGFIRFSGSTQADYRTIVTRFIGETCQNGNQAISDSITDSSVDNNTGTSFFDNFTTQDFGLSQIITIPLNTIQSLTSKSCTSLQVPIPFTNSNVSLPCMTDIYEDNFPSIYAIWKTVSFGIIAYLISIDIFHIVKGFKDPESDKVEVLDL